MTSERTPDPAAVHRAVQMALHLPTREGKDLRVQVLDRNGYVLASGVLAGFDQAAFLVDLLRTVGTFDVVPAALAIQRGCDMLLREAYSTKPPEVPDDLVRKGSGDQWPTGGGPKDFSALQGPG